MGTHNFIPFFVVGSITMLFFEIYFLKSWMNFVKEKNWKPLFYIIPWIFGLSLFAIADYTIWQRYFSANQALWDNAVYVAGTIWFFPKVVVVPFMIFKDIIKYIRKKWKKITEKNISGPGSLPVNEKRREIIQSAGWILAAAPFAAVGKGMITTTYNYQVFKEIIPLANLPSALDGLKIVQLSDIHAGSYPSTEQFERAVDMVNNLKPDIVMITGDFVNFHYRELGQVSEGMKKINSVYGNFACLGNHDHYANPEEQKILHEKIRNSGVDLLINENRTLKIKGESLQLAGSDNSSFNHFFANFDKTFDGLDENLPTILMCHDPENWDKEILGKRKAGLTLSGHTHGGQIVVDIFGEVLSHVRLRYKRWTGLYTENGQSLYVNRGLGTVGPPVRVGVRPEITLITLREPDNIT